MKNAHQNGTNSKIKERSIVSLCCVFLLAICVVGVSVLYMRGYRLEVNEVPISHSESHSILFLFKVDPELPEVPVEAYPLLNLY